MKTRSKTPETLQAAAIELVEKTDNSLLYNAQVIDFLTNNIQSGLTDLAWHYWAKIPELRYTTRYISNALSVATLYVGETDSSGNAPKRLSSRHPANDLLEEFAGGYAGQSELLDRLGLHLTVAGDSVLIGPTTGSGGAEAPFDQWRIYSTDEVSSRNGTIYLKFPGNSREQPIPDDTIAVRIWRPHPRLWWDSDSPVKGSFSVLRELDLLDQHVHANAISRLAGAGLMVIPDEIDLPNSDMEIEGTEIDRFVALLTEVMGLAIKNRESASALIPIMLRGPAEYIDKIQHFDFSTSFSDQVPSLREGAIRRLALGMDVPPEILLGSAGSTSWSAWQCVDQETEILTADGWRTHEDVKEGDTVLTLNHETGLTEWQPVLNMFRKEVIVGEGKPMLSIEGRRHSSLTTWDHKWPVLHAHGRAKIWQREWTISADLNAGDRIITAAPHAAPVEAKWSDALVETIAWFWTEGWIQNHKTIDICQSITANPENVVLIRRALTDLYGPVSKDLQAGRGANSVPMWREDVRQDGKVEWKLNVAASALLLEFAPNKLVSLPFIRELTASQLDLFIDRSLKADGHGLKLGQADPRRLEAFELAGILAGYSIGRFSSVHQGFTEHTQHYVSLGKRNTVQPVTIATGVDHRSLVPYEGIVWCPTTSNATWVARRNGHVFFTGNTDEATLRVHLIPMLQLIASSLTVGWLRPLLETLPLSDKQKEQIPNLVVHFDYSNLKIRQDVSGDAQALFDRMEIDADSLRLATGYGPDAAPTNDELAKQILFALIRGSNPQMVPYAINALRDNFGITLLPEVPSESEGEAPVAPEGNPGSVTPPTETTPVSGPLPDERSQDKQVAPPPIPKIVDENNNAMS